VPYKDPERRRQFQKEYKRQQRRKAQEAVNPLLGFKIYVCPRFPFLWVGREQFVNGLLVTNNPQTQAEVAVHSYFAKHIIPVLVDTDCIPTETEGE
jgi:hypothetical protein